MTLGCWQFPFRGHSVFSRQLHGGIVGVALLLMIFLLCFLMIMDIFSVQLQLTLMVFLLNILWSLLDQGKCLSINLRKVFPMLILMFLLKGGLNQIMFLFLFWFFGRLGLNSRSAVCPEVLSAFSYSVLALLKISSFAYLKMPPREQIFIKILRLKIAILVFLGV